MPVLSSNHETQSSHEAHFDETSSSLLRRVGVGADEACWRQFVAQYEPLLLAYVRRRGLQEHDARDVVQDVFLRLHKSMSHFRLDRDRGRFRTWLWQVTSSALVDWYRAQKRHARVEQERRETKLIEEPIRDSDEDSPEATRRRMLQHAVRQVQVQSLPKTWACFEERVLRGRSSAAVAADLGLTPAAVNVNVSRMMARVRQRCENAP